MPVHVSSEIGRLRGVIVHSPGPELLAVTPSNRADYLYDDIIEAESAQREHRRFIAILERFTTVYEVRKLLTDILAAYDNNPEKIGKKVEGIPVRDIAQLERDIQRDSPDIVVLTVPSEEAQGVVDRVVRVGVKAILNFAPTQLQAPADVTVKTVNMAMELEGLSFALTNRD